MAVDDGALTPEEWRKAVFDVMLPRYHAVLADVRAADAAGLHPHGSCTVWRWVGNLQEAISECDITEFNRWAENIREKLAQEAAWAAEDRRDVSSPWRTPP